MMLKIWHHERCYVKYNEQEMQEKKHQVEKEGRSFLLRYVLHFREPILKIQLLKQKHFYQLKPLLPSNPAPIKWKLNWWVSHDKKHRHPSKSCLNWIQDWIRLNLINLQAFIDKKWCDKKTRVSSGFFSTSQFTHMDKEVYSIYNSDLLFPFASFY